MESKGKLEILTIGGKNHNFYRCNRCNVGIPEEDWTGDNHANCDKYLKGKKVREKAQKLALARLNRYF